MIHAPAHLPEPEEKVYRCDNCGRRVHRYARHSMEDDCCIYCYPSLKQRLISLPKHKWDLI